MPRPRLRRRVDLKKTLFLLPNMITLASVFCGFQSVRTAAESFALRQAGHESAAAQGFFHAALLLVYSLFFDTMDGRVARATKTQSSFGLQLDSLADALSFGVAPGVLVYLWSLHQLGLVGQLVGFFFAACAVVRLARFNVLSMDESGRPTKPSKYIVGLPSPGAAGMLVSLILANHAASVGLEAPRFTGLVLGTTLLFGGLMVSTIKFRSFKDLKPNPPTVALVVFGVTSSAYVARTRGPAFVLVWLLAVYVSIGLLETTWNLVRKLSGRGAEEVP